MIRFPPDHFLPYPADNLIGRILNGYQKSNHGYKLTSSIEIKHIEYQQKLITIISCQDKNKLIPTMKFNHIILAYRRIKTTIHLIWWSNNSISSTCNSRPEIRTFLSNWACYSRTCETQENNHSNPWKQNKRKYESQKHLQSIENQNSQYYKTTFLAIRVHYSREITHQQK